MKSVERMACALALAVAALVAAGAAQQDEDRPLPPSPCPEVFTYEGATVDWDRWYGVVLVATDTPLTGLRLDVWLSRPALALRHNWDGNVTTLDYRRFTILNLYKRIEPGPPKAVRIIVKFDEHDEVPVLRAIELNGRRICSSRISSPSYDDREQPIQQPSRPSRPEYHQDELPLRRTPPSSTSKYYDSYDSRPTQRTPAGGAYDSDSYEQDYKNTVSKTPPSSAADSTYERTTTRRPSYSDERYSYDAEDEYHPPPPPPPPPPARRPEATKRPAHHPQQDTYVKQKVNPQYETPTSRRPPAQEQPHPHSPSAQHKPSGGGPPKYHEPPSALGRPVSPPKGQGQGQGSQIGPPPPPPAQTTPRPAPVYDHRKTPTEPPPRRPVYEDPERPVYDGQRRPQDETGSRRPSDAGARPAGSQHQAPRPHAQHADHPIDVRVGPQPLSDERETDADEYVGRPGREPELPLRQPGNGHAGRLPPGHKPSGASAPGASSSSGSNYNTNNKYNSNSTYNNDNRHNSNNNYNSYNENINGGHQATTRAPAPLRPGTSQEDEQQCGRTLSVTPLITHGQNTTRGQWPWHAAIYQVKGTDLKYICGGTLVSLKYVVTAAHCVTRATTGRAVDPDTIFAYLGKYHLYRWTNEEGVQQGKVAAIHVHPTYNTSDFRGDLALLEFSTPLTYSQYVRPVCLWGHDQPIAITNIVNKDGYIVGWGFDEYGDLTEELRVATMPIVSEQVCLRSYPEFYSRFSNERTYCGGYKNGTSACNGDSGGGMVLPRFHGSTKVWFLRGLVSVSVSRDDQRVCNTEHYVVFTDLAKYGDWMENFLR